MAYYARDDYSPSRAGECLYTQTAKNRRKLLKIKKEEIRNLGLVGEILIEALVLETIRIRSLDYKELFDELTTATS